MKNLSNNPEYIITSLVPKTSPTTRQLARRQAGCCARTKDVRAQQLVGLVLVM